MGEAVVPPRLLTACSALPPWGAAAPAVWQSQSRGPCLERSQRRFVAFGCEPMLVRGLMVPSVRPEPVEGFLLIRLP